MHPTTLAAACTMRVMMAVAAALALQCGRQFVETDGAVAIGVEFAEHAVGIGGVGAACAEIGFEFRFANLAVALMGYSLFV